MRARFFGILALGCLTTAGCTPAATDESGDETTVSSESSTDTETSTDTDTSTDTETSTDTDGECSTPLPPEAFDIDKSLSFGIWIGGLELVVGSSTEFQVGLSQCCYVWDPLETCAVYSVEPEGVGATMDPETGVLTLAADMDEGWFTVRAVIEDGLATVEQSVFVYKPELHPLKGFWHETSRIPCGGEPEFEPGDPINELFFTAAGGFGVTWNPFELYVDYWGDYVADLDVGTLSLSSIDGNYVPGDIDADGSFTLANDELVLEDMWLGTSQGSVEPAACGHRFGK